MSEKVEQNETIWVPSDKQSKVLSWVLENEFECSYTAISDGTGVARSTIYRWLEKDPNFREEWVNLWQKMIDTSFNAVASAMLKKATTGDVPAARLIGEMKGTLKQRLEVTGKDGAAIEHAHSTLDGRLTDIASRKGQGDDAGAPNRTGKT